MINFQLNFFYSSFSRQVFSAGNQTPRSRGNYTRAPMRQENFHQVLSSLLCLFVFCSVSFFSPTTGRAGERITEFNSVVDVLESGQLVVEETITVVSEKERIRHGIYRDFPTDYIDSSGKNHIVDFSVVSVERDNREESFHTKKTGNGVRVYMGSKNVLLPSGVHTYTLRYKTDRQIGFFDDHDELYWNVTGNGWIFPIKQASVTISIPAPGGIRNFEMYTGAAGARDSYGKLVRQSSDSITLATTAPLPPQSGFTVVVSWPKGLVKNPGALQRFLWSFRDSLFLILAVLGTILLFVYYFINWQRVGRDPKPGTIIPRFKPPADLSPAAARYVLKMSYDKKALAALLVNMAVKGVVKIEQQKKEYTLFLLTRETARLSPGEQVVRNALFGGSKKIRLVRKNNESIQKAIVGLQKILRRDVANIYFKLNRTVLIPGIILTIGIIICVVLASQDVSAAATITLWITMWSVGVTLLFYQMIEKWRAALRRGSGILPKLSALIVTLFFLPFFGGWCLGASVLYKSVPLPGIFIFCFLFILTIAFAYLIKAFTIPGRKILDELEGLKMYLTLAEKDRLNLLNPPEKTPELFEKLLPWALVLDVEQQWCDQFSEIFTRMNKQEHSHYQPMWYSSSYGFTANSFSSSLGDTLASTISASSVAPGSSSGFSSGGGGGGFSGGGGGGGGGGGW